MTADEWVAGGGVRSSDMSSTRHIPEIGAVVTLHCDQDGWRAEAQRGREHDMGPLPCRTAPEALAAVGLAGDAPWARELITAALATRSAGTPADGVFPASLAPPVRRLHPR